MTNGPNYFYQSGDTVRVSGTDSSATVVINSSRDTSVSKKDSIQNIAVVKDTVTADKLEIKPVINAVKKDSTLHKKATPDSVQLKKTAVVKTSDTISVIADSVKNVKDTVFTEYKPVFFEPIKRHNSSPLKPYSDMLSVLILISVILTGLLRIWVIKFLRELFNAAFYAQAANKMYLSVNIRNSKPSFVLSALFVFNTGIFIFETLTFYNQTIFGLKGFPLLMFLWAIILIFSLAKSFLYWFTGFVFDTGQITGEYLFNASLLSKVFAIVMLPVIALIPYVNVWLVPALIKLGAMMFIILYILQLIRGSRIFLQNTFSVFYMFLYFCALEILPLVILYKILFS
ncbi:MAG: DUF4271 domain-containing protein [Chlorobi bacterium]|nr:DUF4271 domain-containing protein [Chlorobiota bacterium]